MGQDISPKQSSQSNEQMFVFIKASMEFLVEKVSDMAETLEVLEQAYIREPEIQEMT